MWSRVCCVMGWGWWSWEAAEDGWEPLQGEAEHSSFLCWLPQHLAQAVGFGDAASGPLGIKGKGRGEREVRKKNILQPVSSGLRYYSQNLVMDRFSSYSLVVPHKFFIVVSWNSKHGCKHQEKPLGVEVVSSFSLNVDKKQKLSSTKRTNEAFLEEPWSSSIFHLFVLLSFIT